MQHLHSLQPESVVPDSKFTLPGISRPHGGIMRHRIISCLDALFIGMILGLLFVTLVHASPITHSGQVQTSQWKLVCSHIRQLHK